MLRRTCPLILSFCSKYRTLYIVGSSFLLLYGYSLYSMSERLPLCLLWLLFEMYWALCLSSLGCDLFAPRSPQWIALPPGDKHKAQYCSNMCNGTLNSIVSSSAIHAQILLILTVFTSIPITFQIPTRPVPSPTFFNP